MINILVSQLGLPGQNGSDASALLATDGILIQEDWISSTSLGRSGFTSSSSNGGSNSIISSESGHPGLVRLTTGSSASSGYSNLYLGTNCILLGSGILAIESLIRVPTLSTSAERFVIRIGLGDALTGNFTYGCWFEYSELDSANWRMCCANSSVTKTTSSTVVAENTWVKLKIEINAAGTSAEFFINGTSIGSVSTNLPSSICSPRLNITKSVGTTARLLDVDYYQLQYNFTTSR